jgi:hypothetical protein
MLAFASYTAFHIKLPFLELDYTVSAIDIGISDHSADSQAPKKEHLMKSGIKSCAANRHADFNMNAPIF